MRNFSAIIENVEMQAQPGFPEEVVDTLLRVASLIRSLLIGLCLALVTLLPACKNVSLNRTNFQGSDSLQGEILLDQKHKLVIQHLPKSMRKDDAIVATIALETRVGEEVRYSTMEVRKIHKGYALEYPLYEEKKMRTHFSISHDSHSDWMAGIRMRWKF